MARKIYTITGYFVNPSKRLIDFIDYCSASSDPFSRLGLIVKTR
jgi:hypothetical protein